MSIMMHMHARVMMELMLHVIVRWMERRWMVRIKGDGVGMGSRMFKREGGSRMDTRRRCAGAESTR